MRPRPSDQPDRAAPRLWGWGESPVHLPATMRSATSRTAKHSGSPSAFPRPALPLSRIHSTLMLTVVPRLHSAQSPTPIVTIHTNSPIITRTDMPSKSVKTRLKIHPHRPIRLIRMIPRRNPSSPSDSGPQSLLLSPNFIHHQLPHSLVPCGACMSKAATAQAETVDTQAPVHSISHPRYLFQRERTRPMQSHFRLPSPRDIALMHFSVALQLPP
jgi:hypothetical protein